MMKYVWRPIGLAGLVAVFLTACATPSMSPPPRFDAQSIPGGKYQQKVDHLYFILDASSSMNEGHAGVRKFDTAQSVVRNFNATMPSVDTKIGMRSFGHDNKVSIKSSELLIKPRTYTAELMNYGLTKVKKAGGPSPLERALAGAGKDLEKSRGPIAMVIVSDGADMSKAPLTAAKALESTLGSRLCLYTVQVGDDAGGQKLLSQIPRVTNCGKAVNADSLGSGAAMNAFVKEVLLADLADSDKDGVPDYKDKCPGTPMGVKVDSEGCPIPAPAPVPTKSAEVTKAGTWIYKDIQFEVNKADLRSSSFPVLKEITAALNAQPNLDIEIQGHTDSTGAHDYNIGLSQRRAQTVRAYLISQGIDAGRMTTKGFGPDRPIASNTTKAGRARNRRVEVKPMQ